MKITTEKSREVQSGYPTINELLEYVKRMKLGYGGETEIRFLNVGHTAFSLRRLHAFKVIKRGRGQARTYEMELLFKEPEKSINNQEGEHING